MSDQLARIIAAETGKLQPGLETATRGFEEAIASQQFLESEFSRGAERALVPFTTEIDFMKDRFAREATGFNQDAEASLNVLLQKLQNEGSLAVAEMQQATQLAELEQQKEQFQSSFTDINLGDRTILLDPQGNQVGSFKRGVAPTRGGGGGGTSSAGLNSALDALLQQFTGEDNLGTLQPNRPSARLIG